MIEPTVIRVSDVARLDLKAVCDGAVLRNVRQRVDKGLLGFNGSGFGSWR
jgi:hypothetical protein